MVFCLGSSCCTITRLPWYICSLKGLERAVDMDDTVSRIRLSSPGHCWWRSCNSWGRRAIQAGALLSRKAVTLCGWERSSNNKKKKGKKVAELLDVAQFLPLFSYSQKSEFSYFVKETLLCLWSTKETETPPSRPCAHHAPLERWLVTVVAWHDSTSFSCFHTFKHVQQAV